MAAAPPVFAALIFASGLLLLFSAATPVLTARVAEIREILPLAAIEASQFAASVTGVLLLLISDAVRRRMDAGWAVALFLVGLAVVESLIKGGEWEVAGVLSVLFVFLALARPAFYRRAALFALRPSFRTLFFAALAIAAIGALGFFIYRDVAYRHEMWWTFLSDADAPRFLRGLVGAGLVFLAVLAMRALSGAHPPAGDRRAGLERAAIILKSEATIRPDAHLALLGDKDFLFSETGRSFVQYGSRGRSLIALGAPVGPLDERKAMIWAFRELADRSNGRAVFYSVAREDLADLLDCGLAVQKIGETALVDCAAFTMEGGKRSGLRQTRRRGEREALSFEIVPPEGFDEIADDLKAVSDSWLAIHQGVEKSFSLGRFDPAFLKYFPTAIVRREGEIVAFGNLWLALETGAVSVDLMRYSPAAPQSVMEWLFIELILWAQAKSYKEFDLGMAPLSGLEQHRLAPRIARLGAFIYHHGEEIYGFDGLRKFKNKFGPVWRPLYIAAPTGWDVPLGLTDVALLTSGGVRGALRR